MPVVVNAAPPNASYQKQYIMMKSRFQGEDVEEAEALLDEATKAPPVVQDSHTRSILKGITWRAVASSTTMAISYMITGEIATALKIGFIEVFAKIMIYYAHERIWARIRI